MQFIFENLSSLKIWKKVFIKIKIQTNSRSINPIVSKILKKTAWKKLTKNGKPIKFKSLNIKLYPSLNLNFDNWTTKG